MPIATVGDLVEATSSGREHFCSFRKVPSQATTAGWWADLSMAAGNPVPNYYAAAPLAAKTLDGFDGVFHGAAKTPGSKYVTGVGIMTPTAAALGQYTLCDYVAFYPFVDGDSTDAQSMDNTTVLPRYTDGAGLRVMAVAVAPSTGGGSFTFTYVNQDGATRTSGSGVITDADARAILNAAADLAGAGTLAAAINALADIMAALSGVGTLAITGRADATLEAAITLAATTELSVDSIAAAVWDTPQGELLYALGHNRVVTDPTAGTYTVYAQDDSTVLFTADLWQDADGTTPYAGAGADRRDRLT